ncbi:MAG TPA: heparinase II/III family protein, partial [Blastocatellia bacterium]
MPISPEQFRKIRRLSLAEIKVRSRQRVARLSDRFRRARAVEMSDEELSHEFHAVWREETHEESADKLRCRMLARGRCFLPSFGQREKIVETMSRRFPAERDAIIRTADDALRGKFSLLGHTGLSFGDPPYSPIDWRFDPVSGKRAQISHWSRLRRLNPLGAIGAMGGADTKVIWELNRHAHFVTLGQAYWLTGDNRFAEGFRDQVSAWIDANPAGIGINWASSPEVALRSIAWLWAAQMLVDSSAITPDFFARMLKSMIEHGRHIETYLSYYLSPDTQLTAEALGLFYLGLALPELIRAHGWRDLGMR